MRRSLAVALLCGAVLGSVALGADKDRVWTDDKGRIRTEPVPASLDEKLNNPWPAEWNEEFYTRADHAIRAFSKTAPSGNTWGENDKDSLPKNMLVFLNGNREGALKALEGTDAQAGDDHKHTQGIDYYWCFTIKGQIRKYFYFGEWMGEDYKKKMFEGAKTWTGEDPLRRPHPIYGKGSGKSEGWGPDVKGSWVDVRSTDNLRAMRDTSVYLMAEETGNEATRLKYKQNIFEYVNMLYNVGMMEWDSENYMGHTLAPYHNLYDFARDKEVKALAKAGLDWLYAAGAVKYYRGAMSGPTARDYGGANVVFGAGVTSSLALYFGDTVITDPNPDRDDLYHFTSSYRPPAAVVEMARKNFEKPREILATKPVYKLWKSGEEVKPRFFETTMIGQSYQLGSCVAAAPEETWDVNPFRLVTWSSKRGADILWMTTAPEDGHAGMYEGDEIAQYRNLLVYLRPSKGVKMQQMPKDHVVPEKVTWLMQIPKSVEPVVEGEMVYLQFEKTYAVLRMIGVSLPEKVEAKGSRVERYKDEQFWKFTAKQGGEALCGVAMEVVDAGDFASFEAFREAVNAKGKLDLSGLAEGKVALTGVDGKVLGVTYNRANNLPAVTADGVARDYAKEWDVYGSRDGKGPIAQKWMSGELKVEAGGKVFEAKLTKEGKYTFSNK